MDSQKTLNCQVLPDVDVHKALCGLVAILSCVISLMSFAQAPDPATVDRNTCDPARGLWWSCSIDNIPAAGDALIGPSVPAAAANGATARGETEGSGKAISLKPEVPEKYYLQAGAFERLESAHVVAKTIEGGACWLPVAKFDGRTLHLLIIGAYRTHREAMLALDQFQREKSLESVWLRSADRLNPLLVSAPGSNLWPNCAN